MLKGGIKKMSVEIKVPVLGESVVEATVAKWMKAAGDAVTADEAVVELETDKVTLEVPSPVTGVLSDIVAGEGATVGVDALLALVEEGAAASAKATAKQEAPAQAEAPAPVKAAAPAPAAAAPRQSRRLGGSDRSRYAGVWPPDATRRRRWHAHAEIRCSGRHSSFS